MRTVLPATLLACLPVAAPSAAPSPPQPSPAPQACPLGAIGVPSTRTCMTVSGRGRSDAQLGAGADARLKLDARNETEGGPLRAVAKIGRERH